MKRTLIITMTVDTAPLGPEHEASDADLAEGIAARLDEFYPTDDGYPFVPEDLRVAVTEPEVALHLRDALEVGLGNEDEIGDRALTVVDALFYANA